MTETPIKIDIRSRTLRHTYGMSCSVSLEEARKRGVPEDWIEKHRGLRVWDVFEPFVKKGETVKLNEVRYGAFLPLFEVPCYALIRATFTHSRSPKLIHGVVWVMTPSIP